MKDKYGSYYDRYIRPYAGYKYGYDNCYTANSTNDYRSQKNEISFKLVKIKNALVFKVINHKYTKHVDDFKYSITYMEHRLSQPQPQLQNYNFFQSNKILNFHVSQSDEYRIKHEGDDVYIKIGSGNRSENISLLTFESDEMRDIVYNGILDTFEKIKTNQF